MPQCNDPSCWCNQRAKKPEKKEPDTIAEFKDEAIRMIGKIADCACESNVNEVLSALDDIRSEIVVERTKLEVEYEPWINQENDNANRAS